MALGYSGWEKEDSLKVSVMTMRVKWGSSISPPFHLTNVVIQGGILSPFLFNVNMNDLSLNLNACGTGCRVSD